MTPTYIDATSILTREQVIGLAARSPVSTLFVQEFWLHGVAIRAMADNVFPYTRGIPIRLSRQKDTLYLNPVFIGIGFAVPSSAPSTSWPGTSISRRQSSVSCGTHSAAY